MSGDYLGCTRCGGPVPTKHTLLCSACEYVTKPEPPKPPALEPVAWMVEWTWDSGDTDWRVWRTQETAEEYARRLRPAEATVTPLYPGPMKEEWGRDLPCAPGVDGWPTRSAAEFHVKEYGGRLVRRLVGPWEAVPRG